MSNLAAAPLALSEHVWAVCSYRDKLLVSHGSPAKLSLYPRQYHPCPALSVLYLKHPPLHMTVLTKSDLIFIIDQVGVSLWKLSNGEKMLEVDRVASPESATRPVGISVDEVRAVTGCISGLLEVWSLGKSLIIQEAAFKTISEPVSGVAISRDQELLAVTSDGELPACRVLGRATGQVLHTLYFSEHENEPNFKFQGCFFARSGDLLYTCQSLPHCPCYLTQWDVKADFAPVSTHKLYEAPASAFEMSPLGFTLAVGMETGAVLTVNARTMGVESVEELLPSRVTSLGFSPDGRLISAASSSGSVKCVYNQYIVGLFARTAKGWILFLMLAWVYFYLTS